VGVAAAVPGCHRGGRGDSVARRDRRGAAGASPATAAPQVAPSCHRETDTLLPTDRARSSAAARRRSLLRHHVPQAANRATDLLPALARLAHHLPDVLALCRVGLGP